MTFDEAFDEIYKAFPGKYVSLKYEKINNGYANKNTVEIRVWVDGRGSSGLCGTFRDAINSLSKPNDTAEGINDEIKEVKE
jgi:hypothetical protein